MVSILTVQSTMRTHEDFVTPWLGVSRYSLMIRALYAIMAGRPRLACILNLIYSIVTVHCSVTPYPHKVMEFVARAVIEFAVITFLCFSVVRIFDGVVRLTSEVEQAERHKETITRILSSLCDAFVQWMATLVSSRLPNLWLPSYLFRAHVESKASRFLS